MPNKFELNSSFGWERKIKENLLISSDRDFPFLAFILYLVFFFKKIYFVAVRRKQNPESETKKKNLVKLELKYGWK